MDPWTTLTLESLHFTENFNNQHHCTPCTAQQNQADLTYWYFGHKFFAQKMAKGTSLLRVEIWKSWRNMTPSKIENFFNFSEFSDLWPKKWEKAHISAGIRNLKKLHFLPFFGPKFAPKILVSERNPAAHKFLYIQVHIYSTLMSS